MKHWKRGLVMSRKLVAYFSATGVTAKVAELIADAAGADVHQIQPEVSYTDADLNWMDKNSRSSIEMNDKKIRPAMVKRNLQVEDYDVVFLGFPIWWYIAPTIINTFLESFDFAGKKIILFATSGGSGFGKTVEELRVSVTDDTQIVEGKLLNGKQTLAGVSEWISSLKP